MCVMARNESGGVQQRGGLVWHRSDAGAKRCGTRAILLERVGGGGTVQQAGNNQATAETLGN